MSMLDQVPSSAKVVVCLGKTQPEIVPFCLTLSLMDPARRCRYEVTEDVAEVNAIVLSRNTRSSNQSS